jgi:hypothetical protein
VTRETPERLPAADGADSCPACGARGLSIFHEQRRVPVHSCRLVATRHEAEGFPRGTLRLGLCNSCGFITNVALDEALLTYSIDYEETQGFSPRFREFARGLAGRWIERYGLRDKDVLEIGCGKGEFLTLLCELGVRRGIGVDPAAAPERLSGPAAAQIELIKDVYSEEHARPSAAAVVCRHTLEHIRPVGEFLNLVRRSIADRPDTVVLFEVPDTMRILRECAFWDIYYEHCSYFSRGSLARLFRTAGFDVLAVELAYDDQYVILEGRPERQAGRSRPGEETVEEIADATEGFRRDLAEVEQRWRATLEELRSSGRRAAIWGAGSKAVAFLTTLGVGHEIGCVVDINPYKHGMFIAGTGHEIVPPAFLKSYRPDVVIAMNPIYRDEIGRDLSHMGLEPALTAV